MTTITDQHEESQTWLETLEHDAEERGYYQPLGKHHAALFSDEGTNLLVTFERAEDIRARDGQPLAWAMTKGTDWSSLCLVADKDSWFRDRFVYGYFDRLVDDGFLEDFDRVVFYGAGMGGYAATAFSVVAPGAVVLAVEAQATLDTTIAGWDKRFPALRRTSFSDRYGYGPDMSENAESVFLFFDPENREDSMHASLFRNDNARPVPCSHMAGQIEHALVTMKIMPKLLQLAMDGDLSKDAFCRLYRARRCYFPYLRRLLHVLESAGRSQRGIWLCNSVVTRLRAPRFRKARERARRALKRG